jgi:hypothetical protein
MFWDWLDRIINWREIREQRREMDEMVASWDRMQRDLDQRIAKVFTPAEWAETRERCERKLAEMGPR